MNLKDVVEKYRSLAGTFGRPVPLKAFGLAPQEVTAIFDIFDEDYHISRFFHFTLDPAAEKILGAVFQINGFPQSHISLDPEIESIL